MQKMQVQPSPTCCPLGGSYRVFNKTVTIAAGESLDVVYKFPGPFCPTRMFISTAEPETPLFIEGIKVGTTNVVDGSMPAGLFSPDLECCPLLCLDCVCKPGVPLTLRFSSQDDAPITFIISLFGCYEEAC